ncbi:hypothetical protein JW930_05685 [Candidatus Woesearchaeota archaeon]|nr:hypothetical protein [Candidatus Woesearchaeota archaeon]
MNIANLIFDILIFIIASLPLYFAVKLLGGKTSLLKTVLVNFIAGIVYSFIASQLGFLGRILAFFLLIWIYHEVFRLRWLKAFFAWLIQLFIVLLFYIIMFLLAVFAGIGVLLAIVPKIG